jgi:opacity protein-like surface antigen
MKYFTTAYLMAIALSGFIQADELRAQNSNKTEIYGTVRTVYTWVDTRNSSGEWNSTDALNARIQLGVRFELSENVTFDARVAGRYATDQDRFRFVLDDYTPPSGSYSAGTTTVDLFSVTWSVGPKAEITAGRFQGRFPLQGFIPKGMDRYYAANLNISQTDGLWFKWDVSDRWRLHLIANHNGIKLSPQ